MTESEFRDFMREQTLRHERASRETERAVRALERRTEEEAAALRQQSVVLQDLVEESRAQRQALFRMIDRLGPGPEPASG